VLALLGECEELSKEGRDLLEITAELRLHTQRQAIRRHSAVPWHPWFYAGHSYPVSLELEALCEDPAAAFVERGFISVEVDVVPGSADDNAC
jgi:hypothetical protein